MGGTVSLGMSKSEKQIFFFATTGTNSAVVVKNLVPKFGASLSLNSRHDRARCGFAFLSVIFVGMIAFATFCLGTFVTLFDFFGVGGAPALVLLSLFLAQNEVEREHSQS